MRLPEDTTKSQSEGDDPDYARLRKWTKGIGEIIDGRIVLFEKVLNFINKDYG